MEDDYRALYELPREDRNRLNSHILALCKCPSDLEKTFMVVSKDSFTSHKSESEGDFTRKCVSQFYLHICMNETGRSGKTVYAFAFNFFRV